MVPLLQTASWGLDLFVAATVLEGQCWELDDLNGALLVLFGLNWFIDLLARKTDNFDKVMRKQR